MCCSFTPSPSPAQRARAGRVLPRLASVRNMYDCRSLTAPNRGSLLACYRAGLYEVCNVRLMPDTPSPPLYYFFQFCLCRLVYQSQRWYDLLNVSFDRRNIKLKPDLILVFLVYFFRLVWCLRSSSCQCWPRFECPLPGNRIALTGLSSMVGCILNGDIYTALPISKYSIEAKRWVGPFDRYWRARG